MLKGRFIHRKTCGLCESKKLNRIIDLGTMPLAGDYLIKEEIGQEKFYPLCLSFCINCKAVQVTDIVSPKELYSDYRYLSSYSLSKHFEGHAREMYSRFLSEKSFIVDVGSNDGVLLSPLSKLGVKVLGVDPAENIVETANKKGLETIVGYFDQNLAENIIKTKGQADAVFANNVFAHINNLDEVMKGIKILLKPEGICVFEVNYLVDLLEKVQYDIIYHEHHYYHSLTSLVPFLKRFGFVIFDVKRIPTHNGSIRVYFQGQEGKQKATDSLKKLLNLENKMKIYSLKTYRLFLERIKGKKTVLLKQLLKYKYAGKKIIGYGAPGRANTLLNYCKIDSDILDYIVDESPERVGRFTPGTHIPIYPVNKFRGDNVDYALLLAFSYKEQIMEKEKEFIKRGGQFIMPI